MRKFEKQFFFFFLENVSLIFSLKRKVWEEQNFRKIMFWKEEVSKKEKKKKLFSSIFEEEISFEQEEIWKSSILKERGFFENTIETEKFGGLANF